MQTHLAIFVILEDLLDQNMPNSVIVEFFYVSGHQKLIEFAPREESL